MSADFRMLLWEETWVLRSLVGVGLDSCKGPEAGARTACRSPVVRQLDGPQALPGGVATTFVWGVLSRGEDKSTGREPARRAVWGGGSTLEDSIVLRECRI